MLSNKLPTWQMVNPICSLTDTVRWWTLALPKQARWGDKAAYSLVRHGASYRILDWLVNPVFLAVDGAWSRWGAWSICVNCRMERRRTCDNPLPQGGGYNCPGTDVDVANCTSAHCPYGKLKSCPLWARMNVSHVWRKHSWAYGVSSHLGTFVI